MLSIAEGIDGIIIGENAIESWLNNKVSTSSFICVYYYALSF